MKVAFLLADHSFDIIYPEPLRQRVAKNHDLVQPLITAANWQENQHLLAEVEVILSGWGMVALKPDFLAACPKLKAVLYGAGSVRGFTTPECWERNIVVSSAWKINAIPVAEFAASAVILSLKRVWHHVRQNSWTRVSPIPGAYGTQVGICSLGAIGRLVAGRLQSYDLKVAAYDPFTSAEAATELGVALMPLDELFATSACVTLHTPWLPETEKLIGYDLIRSMPEGGTLINTARGAVIDEDGLIRAMQERPDLTALLDVTHPEPPAADSLLWALPNILMTPHIAGSVDGECARMGAEMIQELERLSNGSPLLHSLTREETALLA